MLLLIDNYDSFVHNLARHFARLGHATRVVRHDAVDVEAIRALQPAAIVISPGPCTPREAGCSVDVVRALHTEVPILGVCLGHQVLAAALGGRVVRAPEPVHGRTSAITHGSTRLFADLPSPLTVCRYHSLVVETESLPSPLRVTARTETGILMALEHPQLPLFGVQFHPEAILTEHGYQLLANFLRAARLSVPENVTALSASESPHPVSGTAPLPTTPVTF